MEGVSILVCCYNSEKRIGKVLEHLAYQEADESVKWEVVIVDNASTDRTAGVALESWMRRDVPLRIVNEPDPGLSNARIAGLREAKYSIVSFIDDDNWVEKQWVQKVYNWFVNNDKIGLLGGQGEAVIEGSKPSWFDRELRSFAVGPQAQETGKQEKALYGAGLSIRKKAWEELVSGGFRFILSGRKGKSLTSGEDYELCLAIRLIGYDLYYDASLRFQHLMPKERLNWDYLIRLTQSFGRTDPVISIYSSAVNDNKGYDRGIRENRWMVVPYSVYNFIRSWPGYLKIVFADKEGKKEHKNFQRTKYRMLESFRLFPEFPGLVAGIRNRRRRVSDHEVQVN
jgi:glycosyltransferase involved in cell wall biosynthesis